VSFFGVRFSSSKGPESYYTHGVCNAAPGRRYTFATPKQEWRLPVRGCLYLCRRTLRRIQSISLISRITAKCRTMTSSGHFYVLLRSICSYSDFNVPQGIFLKIVPRTELAIIDAKRLSAALLKARAGGNSQDIWSSHRYRRRLPFLERGARFCLRVRLG